MTNEQFRIEVQNSVKTWLDWFKQENNISAAILEDALNKYLISLKDQVFAEFIVAASQPINSVEESKGYQKEEELSGEQ